MLYLFKIRTNFINFHNFYTATISSKYIIMIPYLIPYNLYLKITLFLYSLNNYTKLNNSKSISFKFWFLSIKIQDFQKNYPLIFYSKKVIIWKWKLTSLLFISKSFNSKKIINNLKLELKISKIVFLITVLIKRKKWLEHACLNPCPL